MRITPQPLRDPTDTVIQGGALGAPTVPVPASYVRPFYPEAPAPMPLGGAAPKSFWADPTCGCCRTPGRDWPRANAGVVGAGGTWVPLDRALRLGRVPASTTRWQVVGQTLDSGGSPLPSCRVIVFGVARLMVGGDAIVAEVVSSAVDGSFAIEVPGNADYQAIAYLAGSPDVAGITLHPLTPTMI